MDSNIIKNKAIKSLITKGIGVLLILLGIAGIFLPFLPGIVLIYFGLRLLDPSLRLLEKIKGLLKLKDNDRGSVKSDHS